MRPGAPPGWPWEPAFAHDPSTGQRPCAGTTAQGTSHRQSCPWTVSFSCAASCQRPPTINCGECVSRSGRGRKCCDKLCCYCSATWQQDGSYREPPAIAAGCSSHWGAACVRGGQRGHFCRTGGHGAEAAGPSAAPAGAVAGPDARTGTHTTGASNALPHGLFCPPPRWRACFAALHPPAAASARAGCGPGGGAMATAVRAGQLGYAPPPPPHSDGARAGRC